MRNELSISGRDQRRIVIYGGAAALAIAAFVWSAPMAVAQQGGAPGNKVKAAHEVAPSDMEFTDELGLRVAVPIKHPGRRYPATMDFPTGPDVGERLPEFTLPNQNGEMIDFHESRDGGKSAVVFYRSAVW